MTSIGWCSESVLINKIIAGIERNGDRKRKREVKQFSAHVKDVDNIVCIVLMRACDIWLHGKASMKMVKVMNRNKNGKAKGIICSAKYRIGNYNTISTSCYLLQLLPISMIFYEIWLIAEVFVTDSPIVMRVCVCICFSCIVVKIIPGIFSLNTR